MKLKKAVVSEVGRELALAVSLFAFAAAQGDIYDDVRNTGEGLLHVRLLPLPSDGRSGEGHVPDLPLTARGYGIMTAMKRSVT